MSKNQSVLYSKYGNIDDAEVLLFRAIHLDPEFADAHTNLASILEGKAQLTEAEQLYLNAITLEPNNGDYCNNYGAFLTNTGEMFCLNVQFLSCYFSFVRVHGVLVCLGFRIW